MVMTERLYYTDSALRTFSARVVAREEIDRGPAVLLDRTAFYPTSGGQPNDTGRLDDIPVLDVWEDVGGEVWHLLDRFPARDDVRCEIDWDRRFDHMQQHTGQHLLSAAFVELLDAPTVSFHLGADESTIDLDTSELDWDPAFQVESAVNRVIWENRDVEVRTFNESEIHEVPLRKPPQVSGDIRVVWVRGFDASACGGTHVSRTGAVGLLKITRIERYKGGMRIGFVCGERALRDYRRVLRSMQQASAGLSVHQDELPDAVARMREESKETGRSLRAALGELVTYEAQRLLEETPEFDGVRRIAAYLEDRSFEHARAVAAQLGSRPRTLALLATSEPKGTRLVCQRSDDLPDVDATAVLRHALDLLGGRGGGTANQAQGGSGPQRPETIVEALESAVHS